MNGADEPLTRLTLVLPPMLEARVVQLLLEQDPPLPGFTLLAAEGHASDFVHASIPEQVRGRVNRRLLILVLPEARAVALLEYLRATVSNPEVAWWLEPVLKFGRLA